MEDLKIIECPRDAMQGITEFIPTTTKITYINELLKVGFDTIDFGSFVSPKAIPQLRDTAMVLEKLDLSKTRSKLLAIVANERGAQDAATFEEIDYLGYPFSISETFQQRNTNTSIEGSISRLESIQDIAIKSNKKLVVYLSMGFGNPYGDAWDTETVLKWASRLNKEMGIDILSLSDTIGVSEPGTITSILNGIMPELPNAEIGVHLHTTPDTYQEKIKAAYDAGCRRFDGAIRGFGGCPMAKDDLVGNMPTEKMVEWFSNNNIRTDLNLSALEKAVQRSNYVF
ncbi:hydroxymethylglutaryl-CoA lyase [Brumimicrobium glaciale]|jgi:hydroxymethylglutaryl-CoA lyase|uniref:Hydroxymethylglutaryl-CoA lyase n=2 Tax=Brumimicrobium glaciale TaxID=200475 RepID=A0A4Q4KHG2_9FLAO|nr:hydroxymethylglutaryl-CoA lyase [Brumimicrobium glaciale]RYM32190.1 hydroxymethylglutaryl-CoA lyase [Brumimicrobium glaciale]